LEQVKKENQCSFWHWREWLSLYHSKKTEAVSQLVGILRPFFSTNLAISQTKGQGWTAIPTQ